jgi:hypothetical protein
MPAIVPAQTYISAEDEAFYEAYTDGWQTGDWSGRGFKGWQLFAPDYGATSEEQYQDFLSLKKTKRTISSQRLVKGVPSVFLPMAQALKRRLRFVLLSDP